MQLTSVPSHVRLCRGCFGDVVELEGEMCPACSERIQKEFAAYPTPQPEQKHRWRWIDYVFYGFIGAMVVTAVAALVQQLF